MISRSRILDAARITLASGETLDLSNFSIVLTSNLGAADVMQFQHAQFGTRERQVLGRASRTFRPDLFARLTYDVQLDIAERGVHLTVASNPSRSSSKKAPPRRPTIARCDGSCSA